MAVLYIDRFRFSVLPSPAWLDSSNARHIWRQPVDISSDNSVLVVSNSVV